jgi:putative resolvase
MPLRYRYRLDPQDRKLVVADSGATTDDWIRDTIEVLTCFRARTHDCRGARNRALRAVTCAKWAPGGGPAGSAGQDD